MAKGSKGEERGTALKTAMIVIGGLVLSWLTVETAFKPYLDRLRGSIDRSDPNHDPDSDKDSDEDYKGDDKGSD